MRDGLTFMLERNHAGQAIVTVAPALVRQRMGGEVPLRHRLEEVSVLLLVRLETGQILESFGIVLDRELIVQRAAVTEDHNLVNRIATPLEQVAQLLQVGLHRRHAARAVRPESAA